MGSKNLKAIVVDEGSGPVTEADPDKVRVLAGEFRERLRNHPLTGHLPPLYGTTHMLEAMNRAGILPTRNFQFGTFESSEGVSHTVFREKFRIRDRTCWRCPIGCKKVTLATS